MINKAVSVISGIFICLLALTVATSRAFVHPDDREKTISGIVVEAEKNDQGEVTAVAIETRIETARSEHPASAVFLSMMKSVLLKANRELL